MAHLKAGDKVRWNSIKGQVSGIVIKEITEPTKIKGFTANPKDEKEYLVRSESGKEAIHKASALTLI
ncbi:MAG: DUF2945 domain-containing protein [Neisseriaceae bacterium]|jgi:hypothetical protein